MSNILSRLRNRRANPAADHPGTDAKPGPVALHIPRTRVGAWLGRPMTSFHLIVAVTALLITMGLTMVLSASGVYSYDFEGSPWTVFGKQLLWTAIGLLAFYIA
ncbi:putative lipid II flippase FtsW, partial [Mycobacterium sp. ITM-2017-0098]